MALEVCCHLEFSVRSMQLVQESQESVILVELKVVVVMKLSRALPRQMVARMDNERRDCHKTAPSKNQADGGGKYQRSQGNRRYIH